MEDNLDQIEPMIRLAAQHGAHFMVQPYSSRKTGMKHFAHAQDGAVAAHLFERGWWTRAGSATRLEP